MTRRPPRKSPVLLTPADRDRILQGKTIKVGPPGKRLRVRKPRKPIPVPALIRLFAIGALVLIALIAWVSLSGCSPAPQAPQAIEIRLTEPEPVQTADPDLAALQVRILRLEHEVEFLRIAAELQKPPSHVGGDDLIGFPEAAE